MHRRIGCPTSTITPQTANGLLLLTQLLRLPGDLPSDERSRKATGLASGGAQTEASPAVGARVRDRICVWLRNAPLQATTGSGRGGVAGVLNADGNAPYIYGEITGYWLRWSSLYAPDRERMSSAVEFLRRQWSGTEPGETRVGAPGDWRNRAVFTFDLAMAVRGLADAGPIVGDSTCADVAALVLPWIERMIGPEGRLQPFLPLGAEPLPDSWSTRQGGGCSPANARELDFGQAAGGGHGDAVALEREGPGARGGASPDVYPRRNARGRPPGRAGDRHGYRS
jgi:hypothetical protein